MMSHEQAVILGRRLGFVIQISNVRRPYLRWLDGEGALSRHGREPTEAELRMWHMLTEQPYAPWSLAPVSAARDALVRLGVGVPSEADEEPDSHTPAGR